MIDMCELCLTCYKLLELFHGGTSVCYNLMTICCIYDDFRNKLEDKLTVEFIESLKFIPMEPFELNIFKQLGGNHISSYDRRKVMCTIYSL
jgi:hypothetical protein